MSCSFGLTEITLCMSAKLPIGRAVDRQHEIAGAQAGALGGAAGDDLIDPRDQHLLAEEIGRAGEDQDRQQEVGDRPRGHDRGALAERLSREGALALALRHARDPGSVGSAGGVGVAGEFHVAAKRDQREAPARAVPVVETEQLAAEADREHLDVDAAPAADEEMAELVDEDDQRQDEEERQQVAEGEMPGVPECRCEFHSTLSRSVALR